MIRPPNVDMNEEVAISNAEVSRLIAKIAVKSQQIYMSMKSMIKSKVIE